MTKLIIVLLLGLVLEAVGVVYLSRGLKEVRGGPTPEVRILEVVRRGLSNPSLWKGVLFEAAFFASLIYLLSRGDVSFVWPLTSLGLVLTTVSARLVLHEHISAVRWFGVVLIVAGSMLVVHSESRARHSVDSEPMASR